MSDKSRLLRIFESAEDPSLFLSPEGIRRAYPEFAAFVDAEERRLAAMIDFDLEAAGGLGAPVGTDEAGRGPLAGPVTAACVRFSVFPFILFLNDSKRMNARERLAARRLILLSGCESAVRSVSSTEIDATNILKSSLRAMREAFLALGRRPGILLVDGNRRVPDLDFPQMTVVGGDSRSFSVAAASVLAKTERDEIMEALSIEYPGYGFERHRGYPVKAHYEAIERLGPSPVHRLSFLSGRGK